MKRRAFAWLVLTACGPEVAVDDADGGNDTGSTGTMTGPSTDPSATAPTSVDESDDEVVGDEAIIDDFGSPGDVGPAGNCADGHCKLDVLVVVDNTSRTGDFQLALTRSLVGLVGRIEALADSGEPIDVQMMFTTTDMGNPQCTPFQPPDYAPAMGAPIAEGCNARIDRFTGLGGDPEVRPDVCQTYCPSDVAPADPFVAFFGENVNVPENADVDIDGDGDLDSAVARSVACLAPQGLDGCGYEQPLESMLQALNPGADWNVGERPFLRPDSTLLIVLATDEMDCSMTDFSVMNDEQWYEPDEGGNYLPSSAICWNAGSYCAGPNAEGIYTDCYATDGPMLSPDRYRDYLVEELREAAGREVLMVAFTGVPAVTKRNGAPPYHPIAGGLADLVYRDWEYQDLLPPDLENGVSVDDKRFATHIGPACSEYGVNTGRFVQAVPNIRVTEVCESLDQTRDLGDAGVRCCVESVCDYAMPLDCVDGWLSNAEIFPRSD